MSFDEAILLKIKRDFTHVEAVNLLVKELSAARFKIGELESEVGELKHEINKPKEGKTAKQWKQDDFFKELKEQLQRTMLKKRDMKKDCIMWQNKYLSLVSRAIVECPGLVKKEQEVQASVATEAESKENDD